jgi:type I restriction enzyme M protein
VLFIDARKLGFMATRTLRNLSPEELAKISNTYHNWRNAKPAEPYHDVPGFCKSASIAEIATHDYVLTPGRFVGAADVEDSDIPVEERLLQLRNQLLSEFEESDRLQAIVKSQLSKVLNDPK